MKPYFSPKNSQLEIRLYCELKEIFNDVQWREKVQGLEFDFLISKYNLVLEVDEYLLHKGKEENDRAKTHGFVEKGYKVIRIRDYQLESIAKSDIVCNERDWSDHLPLIHRILNDLQFHLSLSSEDEAKVNEYLASNKFQNIKEYKKHE